MTEGLTKITEEKIALQRKSYSRPKIVAEIEANKENIEDKKEEINEITAIESQVRDQTLSLFKLMTIKADNKKILNERNQLQEINMDLQREIEKVNKSEEILQVYIFD